MFAPAVIFPDVVALVVGHLDDVLPVLVAHQVPNPRPARFVTIRRTGGAADGVVDAAQVTVEVWAGTAAQAGALEPGAPANQYGPALVHPVTKSSPKDFIPEGGKTTTEIYAMTDGVTDEQFEEAIEEAKQEGNLSRANVEGIYAMTGYEITRRSCTPSHGRAEPVERRRSGVAHRSGERLRAFTKAWRRAACWLSRQVRPGERSAGS